MIQKMTRKSFAGGFAAAALALSAVEARGACAWMQEARQTPRWFTEGVMYQIQPRAFTPEGTLKAAERKLSYLRDLGVTIVYLVPVMKMDESQASCRRRVPRRA